jgi:epsilon-lactone hydrolase
VPTHVFHIFWTFLPEAMDALAEIGQFVRDVTATPADAASKQA